MELLNTGIIYRNPKPHLVSRHAFFPSLSLLPSGRLFAGFDLGSAFEAVDVRSFYSLSNDGGGSWSEPEAVALPEFAPPFSCTCRFRCTPEGEIVGIGAVWDRKRSSDGLVNPETGGFVETFPFLVRADASSLEWQAPAWIDAPLTGPFEICSPILPIQNGDWVWPASTCTDWEGSAVQGLQTVALRSKDRGRTWKSWSSIMDGRAHAIGYWEIKLAVLADGRILALSWSHDTEAAKDLPIHYAISDDGGVTFSPPVSTGLTGQTCTPLLLGDGRILCAYRRSDMPGLWTQLASIEGSVWRNQGELLLWEGSTHAALGSSTHKFATEAMSALRFGLPTSILLPDGTPFVAFWCIEDGVSLIRYFHINV